MYVDQIVWKAQLVQGTSVLILKKGLVIECQRGLGLRVLPLTNPQQQRLQFTDREIEPLDGWYPSKDAVAALEHVWSETHVR